MSKGLFLVVCCVFAWSVCAEFRIWEDKKGNIWEAEFVTLSAGEVVMRDQQGERIRMKPDDLSENDKLYLEKAVPPVLSLDVSKTTANTGSNKRNMEAVKCVATIKQTGTRPYTGKLTAVLLTMGADIRTGSASTVNKKEHSFSLPDTRGEVVEFSGDRASFHKSSNKSGRAYYGYVLVVWDRFGNPIAIKSNRDSLAEQAEKLARPGSGKQRLNLK